MLWIGRDNTCSPFVECQDSIPGPLRPQRPAPRWYSRRWWPGLQNGGLGQMLRRGATGSSRPR